MELEKKQPMRMGKKIFGNLQSKLSQEKNQACYLAFVQIDSCNSWHKPGLNKAYPWCKLTEKLMNSHLILSSPRRS